MTSIDDLLNTEATPTETTETATEEPIPETVTDVNEALTPDTPVVTESEDVVLERLLDAITPLSEVPPFYNFFFYGPFGCGKTTLAASVVEILPEDKFALYLDLESGFQTIQNNHSQYAPKMRHMEYRSLNQLEALADRIGAGKLPWVGAFIIDTVGELQDKDMDNLMIQAAYNASLAGKSRSAYDPDGLWQENSNHMRRVLSQFKDLPIHFIMLTHEQDRKEKGTGITKTTPNLTPKVMRTLMQMCSVVGYMSSEGEGKDRERRLEIQPSAKLEAKSRLWGGLPDVLINPTIKDLLVKGD